MSSPVLLYDGSCGFCSAAVQFVLRHDRVGTLRFAALESRWAKRALASHPELQGVDSVLWAEPATGQVLARSAAALQVARYLGGAWSLALALRVVPSPLRDAAYDLIARNRHRLMPEAEHCLLPSAPLRHRFLND